MPVLRPTVQSLSATIRSGRYMRIRTQWARLSTARRSRFMNVSTTVAARAAVSPLTSTWLSSRQPAGHTCPPTTCLITTSTHSQEPTSIDSETDVSQVGDFVRLFLPRDVMLAQYMLWFCVSGSVGLSNSTTGRKTSAAKFLCVKTFSGKGVATSFFYLTAHRWIAGDVLIDLTPLQKTPISTDFA